MRKHIILIDLDHTISDAAWRDPMIAANDWDAYHSEFHRDLPCTDVIQMVNAMAICGFSNLGLTARPEKWRKATMDWLFKHGVKLHDVLMRPDQDYRPAPELKMALAEKYLDQVAFILDDREDVISAFKARGVTGMIVHGRKY